MLVKNAAKLRKYFEICKFYCDFLKFAAVWSLSPGERKKKKKRTKRIIKKNVTPSTYKYVRNTLNLLNKGGSTARTRVRRR